MKINEISNLHPENALIKNILEKKLLMNYSKIITKNTSANHGIKVILQTNITCKTSFSLVINRYIL